MCNINGVSGWILAAEVAVLAAIAVLTAALYVGGNIFGAFQALGLMATVCIALGAAIAALGFANAVLSSCFGGACVSQATSLRTALFATITSLSVELTLLVVGTFIPGAASIVGPGALGVLLAVAASWFVLSGALFALAVCAAGPASPPAPLAVFATVLGFLTGFASIIPAALGIVQLIQLAAAG